MTGHPRTFLRPLSRPLSLRRTSWGGPRWLVQQSDGQALQPRLPRLLPPTRPRPRQAVAAGRASCLFSTSRPSFFRDDDSPDDKSPDGSPRNSKQKRPDRDVLDPREIKILWGPGPEDWRNPHNWRMPYPALTKRLPSLPRKPPPTPLVKYLSPPLNILFCGSDEFSCRSLQALYDEMLRQQIEDAHAPPASQSIPRPGRIESISVVVRPAKPKGRGLKLIPSPVQQLAESLKLPVHIVDSFTKWIPPLNYNLIIAVSFGLFVPPRLLRSAMYGGLNVHPSLLPDLHGASPIEHAFLLGRRFTGVTVQTLDEKRFDGGRVLRVSQPVELVSRSAGAASPTAVANAAQLYRVLAPMGARILVQTLRLGLYVHEALLRRVHEVGPERAMLDELKDRARYEERVGEPVLPIKELMPAWPAESDSDRASKTQFSPNVVGSAAAAAVDGEAPLAVVADNAVRPGTIADAVLQVPPAAAPRLTKAEREVPWLPRQLQKEDKKKDEHDAQNEQHAKEKPEKPQEQNLQTSAPLPPTTAIDIDRRARALGRLWTQVHHLPEKVKLIQEQVWKKVSATSGAPVPLHIPLPPPVRILLDDIDAVACPPALQALLAAAPGPLGAAFRSTGGSSSSSASAAGEAKQEKQALDVRTVTFEQQEPHVTRITLPYAVDATDNSIVLPMGVPVQDSAAKAALCCVRVGSIIVAGTDARPAASALEPFSRHLDELEPENQKAALAEVAWNIVFRDDHDTKIST